MCVQGSLTGCSFEGSSSSPSVPRLMGVGVSVEGWEVGAYGSRQMEQTRSWGGKDSGLRTSRLESQVSRSKSPPAGTVRDIVCVFG